MDHKKIISNIQHRRSRLVKATFDTVCPLPPEIDKKMKKSIILNAREAKSLADYLYEITAHSISFLKDYLPEEKNKVLMDAVDLLDNFEKNIDKNKSERISQRLREVRRRNEHANPGEKFNT